MKNRTYYLSVIAAACMLLSSCSGSGASSGEGSGSSADALSPASSASSGSSGEDDTADAAEPTVSAVASLKNGNADMFTTRDYEIGWSDCTEIDLSDGGSSVSGSGASVSGNVITITDAGSYLFKGSLSDGQVMVDADDKKVQIILDNASVACTGSAALYIKKADKVFVTTSTGSVNSLVSAGEFSASDDSKIDGAVFAKSDVTFNGSGTLKISCETAHGIVCKDDLKFTCGTFDISSGKKGIDCNESVRIANGKITVASGTDGIHAENSDGPEKAFVYIGGGEINITSGGDAVDASGEITAEDGTITVVSDGGAANAPAHTNNDFGMRWDRDSTSSDSGSGTSAKGIKSDTLITVTGGSFVIDSSDDAIHSNGSVVISGGSVTASSGDDGIHAETSFSISDGIIDITESYEGIEGEVIGISGGSINVRASDDGMNAAGGQTESDFRRGIMDTDENARIEISGGSITVNADGDGIDSNGYLTVSGGVVYVSGPTNSGNGALDYGISATVTGGSVVAAGAVGMAENFGSDSTQGSILYTFDSDFPAGTELSLLDSDGNILVSYAPEKTFRCAVLSAPGVASGSTYTVKAGDSAYTVEMTSNIYGESSGFGFGGGRGGWGGWEDRDDTDAPFGGNAPENFPDNADFPDFGGFGGFGGKGGRGGRKDFADEQTAAPAENNESTAESSAVSDEAPSADAAGASAASKNADSKKSGTAAESTDEAAAADKSDEQPAKTDPVPSREQGGGGEQPQGANMPENGEPPQGGNMPRSGERREPPQGGEMPRDSERRGHPQGGNRPEHSQDGADAGGAAPGGSKPADGERV